MVPFAADAAGLRLEVPRSAEVVDHVLPGIVALLAAAILLAGGSLPGGTRWRLAAAAVFLAGLFITASHLPLIAEVRDAAPVGASLVHFSAGLPVLVAGAFLLAIRPAPRPAPR